MRPVRATDNPQALGGVDVVLLAVKGWQVPEAMTDILSARWEKLRISGDPRTR